MKKIIALFIAVGIGILSSPGKAADESYDEHAFNTPFIEPYTPFELKEGQGMTYHLAGDDEDGAFKLFMKNAAEDPTPLGTAEGFNAITPAAGIQFQFEF